MMRIGRHQWQPEDGIALIELLAVLVILALATAITIPGVWRTRDGQALATTAIEMASMLKDARRSAIKLNRHQMVILDPGRRRYWGGSSSASKSIPQGISIAVESRITPEDQPETAAFRFNSDGRASGGRIVLRSSREVVAISIDWMTGATEVNWSR